jgi:4-amino-4-deoxy-L-arabinose transferase-like glycosyltransferase
LFVPTTEVDARFRCAPAAPVRVSSVTPVWLTWRFALAVVVGVTALRLIYSIWLSPWDLVGDEAYYWIQSQHLDLCYNEKGPLLAWMIAAACRAFGNVEWAVRLPVLIASGLGAWGAGRLALFATRRDQRVGAIAAYLVLLLPAFQANAQVCTQDGVMIPLWIALTACGLRQAQRWRDGQGVCGGWGGWLMFWALMGVGMLLKQSVLTFLPGMVIFWVIERRSLPLRPVFFAQQLVGLAVLALFCLPMFIWNARHGWPMLAHTIGHLSGQGDQAGHIVKGNPLKWEGAVIGGLFAAFGPMLLVMIWVSVRQGKGKSSGDQFSQRWLLLSAWFSTIFYVALALTKPVIASWPLPSMVPLVVTVAQALAPVLARETPGKHLRRFWRGSVGYGVIAGLLIAFPNALYLVPGAPSVIHKRILGHMGDAREEGRRLEAIIAEAQGTSPRRPLLVAPNYGMASLTSFYVPGHPPVASRDSHLTGRHSALDWWPQTNLDDPMHLGQTLILMQDNRNDPDWRTVLQVDQVRSSSDPKYLIATNFRGFRTSALAKATSHPGDPR